MNIYSHKKSSPSSNVEKRLYLQQRYLELGNRLPERYGGDLQNHCYWRISSDAACRAPWKTKVRTPFYKYARFELLQRAVSYLEYMMAHEDVIADLNAYSLKLRGKRTGDD
ncbi:MAG: hypothetical protein ACOC2C_08475 [Cyclonatronaceae bacterium]